MLRSVRSEEEEMEEEAAIPPSPRDGSNGGMDAAFASVEKLEESLKAKGKQKKRP